MVCLILFVFFIHNISESIQIDNIISHVYHKSKKQIFKKYKHDEKWNKFNRSNSSEIKVDNWYEYSTDKVGFLQEIDVKDLVLLALEHDFLIKILEPKGSYLFPHVKLFALDRKVDEKVLKKIYNNFSFFHGEPIEKNYFYGFTLLREISVKALSPGNNDVGIALTAIPYLASLIDLKMQYPDIKLFSDNNGDPRVMLRIFTVEDMLDVAYSQIIHYGRDNVNLMKMLLKTINKLSLRDISENIYRKDFNFIATRIVENAESGLNSRFDRESINNLLIEMNEKKYFDLPLLS
jgi:uncharacterized membrane protein